MNTSCTTTQNMLKLVYWTIFIAKMASYELYTRCLYTLQRSGNTCQVTHIQVLIRSIYPSKFKTELPVKCECVNYNIKLLSKVLLGTSGYGVLVLTNRRYMLLKSTETCNHTCNHVLFLEYNHLVITNVLPYTVTYTTAVSESLFN